MARTLITLITLALAVLASTPASADGQILDRIRRQTQETLEAKKKAAEEKVVTTTGQVVDSVAEKTARAADTVVTRSGNALNTAVQKTEQTVAGALQRDGAESALARELATGQVTLADIQFADDGEVAPSSLPTLRTLAKLLKEREDVWIIEAHTAAGLDDQARSDMRARAVKAVLVTEGIAAGRVFARGLGSTRPAPGAPAAERIELVRMQ
jgi:outer membrane protein OmpA-like peptidoglycan-associated protein